MFFEALGGANMNLPAMILVGSFAFGVIGLKFRRFEGWCLWGFGVFVLSLPVTALACKYGLKFMCNH